MALTGTWNRRSDGRAATKAALAAAQAALAGRRAAGAIAVNAPHQSAADPSSRVQEGDQDMAVLRRRMEAIRAARALRPAGNSTTLSTGTTVLQTSEADMAALRTAIMANDSTARDAVLRQIRDRHLQQLREIQRGADGVELAGVSAVGQIGTLNFQFRPFNLNVQSSTRGTAVVPQEKLDQLPRRTVRLAAAAAVDAAGDAGNDQG